ncbi:DUF397 domain-containing protein [Actinomadura barringtoniae]|uniref:DUF397 domain-containing protein n=1 Tax=Actinomadura barringtoniae TaxID=1427535 RepID=A0A939T635_9ACTN|nr:DUF397 domain-containing protein [Actinomadura barringtoniae]MBO2451418.1 DUF397 domain-containing protein [Actinomadura barringtoniae]
MSQSQRRAISRAGTLSIEGTSHQVVWHKASASGSGGCVEVASAGSAIFVQDSKVADGGAVIALPTTAWSCLVDLVRTGRLDLPVVREGE